MTELPNKKEQTIKEDEKTISIWRMDFFNDQMNPDKYRPWPQYLNRSNGSSHFLSLFFFSFILAGFERFAYEYQFVMPTKSSLHHL